MTPLSLVFITHRIRALQFKKRGVKIRASNLTQKTWINNMGLSTACGLDYFSVHKNRVGDGRNFIPIVVVNKRDFIQKHGLVALQEGIDTETSFLARVLLHQGMGPAFDAVQYSLREIIRNVFEHSAANTLIYCAQYYPKLRRAHLAIADDGIGIPVSIRNNPKFATLDDKNAVEISLMPGVSGNYLALSGQKTEGRWTNSGYGLYMTSRLCRNSGNFYVFSNRYGVALTSSADPEKSKLSYRLANFQGTIISMELNLESTGDFSHKLKRYAEEGKIQARSIAGARVIDASTASLMLRRDFERSGGQ